MKLLLWLLLIVWVYLVWRSGLFNYVWQWVRMLHTLQKASVTGVVETEETIRTQVSPTSMLACARCGVHVPSDEAVLVGGLSYCSVAHAKKAKAGN